MRRAILVLLVLGTWTCCPGFAAPAHGEDFRIDTDIYVGSATTPSAEVLTIFQGGIVYDFQKLETMVLEPRRGKITFLDKDRQARTTLETVELLDATISLQTEALKSKNRAVLAAAKPDFQTSTDEVVENGSRFTRLMFKSAPLQYTVLGQAARSPEAAQEYKYLVDWSARLNSIRTGQPAAARLEVNEALAAKGLVPYRIERTMPGGTPVRTQHSVIWKLSQDDHSRIDETGTQLVNFRLESFDQYVANQVKKR